MANDGWTSCLNEKDKQVNALFKRWTKIGAQIFSNLRYSIPHKNPIKKELSIPLVIGYKKNISKVLDIELKATKIYALVTDMSLIKREYQIKPIIKENND